MLALQEVRENIPSRRCTVKIENTPPSLNTPLQKKVPLPGEEIPQDSFVKASGGVLPSQEGKILSELPERANPRDYLQSLRHSIKAEDLKKGWKPSEPAPKEETKKSFWRWDFEAMPPGFKRIDATCRAVGKNSYIFVEDASWGTKVTEASVARLQQVFEKSTPEGSLDPNKGIYAIDSSLFGNPPDMIDKDPRVYLLITDMGKYHGQGFDGYFNPFDEMSEDVAWKKYHQHSNEVEMLYLNCGSDETPIDSDYMQAVTGHELQHLIHFNYDTEEESWINESCSEAAMTATGFFTDKQHLARYAANPSSPLIVKDYVDYGACLLWGTYLLEKLGPDFFPPFVANTKVGASSITDTLENLHRPENFRQLFDQWVVANFASSRGVSDPRYGYSSFPVPPMKVAATLDASGGEHSSTLKSSGVDYIALQAPEQGKLKLALEVKEPRREGDADYGVQLLRFNDKELEVMPLDLTREKSALIEGGGELYLALYGLGGKDFSYSLKTERA
jgi:hypothetical protein